MTSLITKLLGTSSLPGLDSGMGQGPARVLSVKPSTRDPGLLFVQPAGGAPHALPLYSITPSRLTKPNVVMYYGPPEANHVLATADTGTFSSRGQLSVRGQQMATKLSSTSGNFSVDSALGQFKWKPSQLGGSSLELVDAQGTRLAKYKSAGIPGMQERKLEVYVHCDDFLVEMMVISAVVARQTAKAQAEVAGEVVSAVVGA